MSNIDINSRGFEESIRNSLQEVEVATSDALWNSIEQSLDSTPIVSPLNSLLRWSGAIAASILLATAANFWFMQESTTESYQAMIAEFQTLPQQPIEIKPVMIGTPHHPTFANNTTKTADIKESKSTEETTEYKSPTKESTKTTHKNKERKEYRTQEREYNYNTDNTLYVAQEIKVKNPINISMALSGSSASSSSFQPKATPHMLSNSQIAYNDVIPTRVQAPGKIEHQAPLTFALSAAYSLNERWSIESGASYSRLVSAISNENDSHSQIQKVDFIGIPLRLNYNIYSTNALSLYTSAGAQIERCILATLDGKSIEEKLWHPSLDAALGVQYNINSWLGLYAEPEMTYYMSQTALSTIRNQSPLSFNLRFGLRFRID